MLMFCFKKWPFEAQTLLFSDLSDFARQTDKTLQVLWVMIVLLVIVTPIEHALKNCRMQSICNVNQLDCYILRISLL